MYSTDPCVPLFKENKSELVFVFVLNAEISPEEVTIVAQICDRISWRCIINCLNTSCNSSSPTIIFRCHNTTKADPKFGQKAKITTMGNVPVRLPSSRAVPVGLSH